MRADGFDREWLLSLGPGPLYDAAGQRLRHGGCVNATGWEATLEGAHARYRADGLAYVFRSPPPVRVVRKGRGATFTAAWCAKGACDFAGVIAGGRAVAFDAKLCSGSRWSLYGRGGLLAHQARQLRHTHSLGGLAFVALHFAGRGWVVPYSVIEASAKKSWALADVAAAAHPFDGGDWLCYTRSEEG